MVNMLVEELLICVYWISFISRLCDVSFFSLLSFHNIDFLEELTLPSGDNPLWFT